MKLIPKDNFSNTEQDLLARLKEEANRKAAMRFTLTPEIKDLSENHDVNRY